MKIGIVGLPNVGKSSLFNLLTQAHAQVAKFPFTTIDRNVGVAPIPDTRLLQIIEITKSPKMKFAHIDFTDIAGLIQGASKGEGLGNTFLAHIRDVDLVIHLLRCFADSDIPHSESTIVPQRDYDVVRTELMLADLSLVERRIEKIKKKAECREELETLSVLHDALGRGKIPGIHIPPDLPLLSTKQEIIVLNSDEDGTFSAGMQGYRLSVKLEEDIIDFTEEEKGELRKEAGLEVKGCAGLLELCMNKLSIILFYTIKGEETRAWPIKKGTTVLEAAGMIHSDMKQGFIKAEVLHFSDFIKIKGFSQAQHSGLTKIEGKDYVVCDGDIILIKFRGQ